MSDRQRVNSVFQNDSLIVICRECRLVDSFGAYVVFSASDGIHRPMLRLS